MKISVIIPVYNAEKYIKECLDSFVNQTFKDFEIICIDDGSTDNSLNILNEYKNKFEHFFIYSQQNQGAGIARNTGISYAKGEYIYFFDADDWTEPNLFEEVYNVATENKTPDILKFRGIPFDNKTKKKVNINTITYKNFPEKLYGKIINLNSNPLELFELGCNPWLGFYKREFLLHNNINFPDIKVGEDGVFYRKCIVKAKSIIVINKTFVHYRMNNPKSLDGEREKFFDSQIEAVNYSKKIYSDLNPKLKNLLLQKSLSNLFVYFSKSINTKYSKKNYKLLKEFVNNINIKEVNIKLKLKIFIIKLFPYYFIKLIFLIHYFLIRIVEYLS